MNKRARELLTDSREGSPVHSNAPWWAMGSRSHSVAAEARAPLRLEAHAVQRKRRRVLKLKLIFDDSNGWRCIPLPAQRRAHPE